MATVGAYRQNKHRTPCVSIAIDIRYALGMALAFNHHFA
jgi:hypothetical protein